MNKYKRNIILYAPNVHLGGGLILLKAVIDLKINRIIFAQLDKRVQNKLKVSSETLCLYAKNSVLSRLYAEWRLWRISNKNDIVLCFNSLPPLFPRRGDVIVFIQNRLLFSPTLYHNFPFRIKIRLFIERWYMHARRKNCTRYIVQTPSMETEVKKYLGSTINSTVLAFSSALLYKDPHQRKTHHQTYDFVYIASGDAHKNHKNLLEAWRLLAEAGMKPSLALTVAPDMYPSVSSEISHYISSYDLNIVNLGNVPWKNISSLYRSSSALIFPSKTESFGLPLIEAYQLGLPILAPELDYVRDVIHPKETFCPNSPLSIARAIRRFLGKTEPLINIRSPEEFLREILS